jgi:hypothetical protein
MKLGMHSSRRGYANILSILSEITSCEKHSYTIEKIRQMTERASHTAAALILL